MKIDQKTSIGQIAAQNYKTAEVFESLGIDFWLKGGRTIGEVCQNQSLDFNDLVSKLTVVLKEPVSSENDYNNWQLDKLANHIVDVHHKYVDSEIPVIQQYLNKICEVHGAAQPELYKVKELFDTSAGQFTAHMKKEEIVLFPYLKKMLKAKENNEKISPPFFGSVNKPIAAMLSEHDNEGDRFEEIKKISQNYTLPDGACATYQASFQYLKEFEDDLHLHIHLENNILFPKIIELEKSLEVI